MTAMDAIQSFLKKSRANPCEIIQLSPRDPSTLFKFPTVELVPFFQSQPPLSRKEVHINRRSIFQEVLMVGHFPFICEIMAFFLLRDKAHSFLLPLLNNPLIRTRLPNKVQQFARLFITSRKKT
jgi:hypothetical protein